MAIPGVSAASDAAKKLDPLIAESRILDDYHTACNDGLVIEGEINGRRVRFDPRIIDLSVAIKAALESRVVELLGKISAKTNPT